MNAGQRSARRLAAGGQQALARDSICTACLTRLAHQSRRHAATAAAATAPSTPSHTDLPNPPVTQTGPQKAFRLMAAPVISRAPLLTRDLTSFEKAFYLYQKRLNERLALPFSRYFYYRKGTMADGEWKRKMRLRKSAARDIGIYSGYGDEAWNDEVLVGDDTAEPARVVDALFRDAQGEASGAQPQAAAEDEAGAEDISGDPSLGAVSRKNDEVLVERPLSRVTEADEQNDVRSLNRKQDRTLYLLVQDKDKRWRFPQDRVYGRENLHQAAERTIIQALGINLNTWLVGNHPIGHHAENYPEAITSEIAPNSMVPTSTEVIQREEYGEKVFFMKARIMGGRPDLSKNEYSDLDYQWLAKEEIAKAVGRDYFKSVRNMLAER